MPTVDLPQGHQLWFCTDGPADGPAVVLSNSIGTNVALWDPIVAPLVAAGFLVVRYDTRGHGQSSTPPGPYSVTDLADDVVRVLDALCIPRAHVGGISLGGMTALMVALRHPQRVRALVAANTGAKIGTWESWSARAAVVQDSGLEAIEDAVIAGWLTSRYAAVHPEVVVRMHQWFRGNDPAGYAACCAALGTADLRPDLPSITAPTLVIAGYDDVPTPPALTSQIAAAIPGATYREIPGAHLSVQESPREFAAAVLAHLAGAGSERDN